jgi:carbon storage regulator CsrA
MLVLSRKKQEAVVVAGADGSCLLKITVLEIREGVVRLGFEADAGVPVHRWEVWRRLMDFQEIRIDSDAAKISHGPLIAERHVVGGD